MLPTFRDAEDLYRAVPWAPGQSPFHIRGTGYVFHDQYVRENLPGGRDAQYPGLGALRDHPAFHQLWLASSWYDIMPLIALGYACARAAGTTFEEFVRIRARQQAENDIRHVRKLLVKLASPSLVAKRLPGIAISYLDFATSQADGTPGHVTGTVEGVPDLVVPWLACVCEGFIPTTLEINGAQGLRTQVTHSPEGREAHGRPLYRLRIDVHWDP